MGERGGGGGCSPVSEGGGDCVPVGERGSYFLVAL